MWCYWCACHVVLFCVGLDWCWCGLSLFYCVGCVSVVVLFVDMCCFVLVYICFVVVLLLL